MKKVLMYGWYGYRNIGDEAILQAVADDCLSLSAQPVAVAGDPTFVTNQFGVPAVRPLPFTAKEWAVSVVRGRLFATLRELRTASLLLIGGGGFLSDDQSLKRISRYARVLDIARTMRVPAVLHGVGVGPLISSKAQRMIRKMCRHFSYISVRDEESRYWLRVAGVEQPIHVTADPVVSFLRQDAALGRQILVRGGGSNDGRKVIGVSLLRPTAGKDKEDHSRNLAGLIDGLRQRFNAEVVLIPFQRPFDARYFAESDDAALPDITRYLRGPIPLVLSELLSPVEVARVLASLDLVVGFHLHAMILACTQSTPVVGIPYHFKGRAFLEKVGLTQYAVPYDEFSAEAVLDRVQAALSSSTMRTVIGARMIELRHLAETNRALLKEVLSGGAQ